MNLQETLSLLAPISLNEIEGAELMSRLDMKFLIRPAWITSLLLKCQEDYRILEVQGERLSGYTNRFIDTLALDSLHAHTRGRNIRFKARIRQYNSNRKSFLEIKRKTVQGMTVKSRIERNVVDGINDALTPQETAFLSEHYGYNDPVLSDVKCTFERITLVSNQQEERITIDLGVAFQSGALEERMDNLAIMEVKQSNIDRSSPFLKALEAHRFESTPLARRASMSKYVVGMLLLNPNLPPRTYRSNLRRIQRLRKQLD